MVTITVQGVIPQWTIADRLRKAREQAGLEQASLALELGVAKNTVSNYERGNVAPRRPVLVAWAMATGVSLDWLCPRQDSNLQPTDLWSIRRGAGSAGRHTTRRTARLLSAVRCATWGHHSPTDLWAESWELAA